ncbi:hypothetical protein HAX54_018149, partial [Datura stramonium]|nr:hypothetical protein [Datura stramonium]
NWPPEGSVLQLQSSLSASKPQLCKNVRICNTLPTPPPLQLWMPVASKINLFQLASYIDLDFLKHSLDFISSWTAPTLVGVAVEVGKVVVVVDLVFGNMDMIGNIHMVDIGLAKDSKMVVGSTFEVVVVELVLDVCDVVEEWPFGKVVQDVDSLLRLGWVVHESFVALEKERCGIAIVLLPTDGIHVLYATSTNISLPPLLAAFRFLMVVQLTPYDPNVLDASVLWTESRDVGDGYRAVRMVNNINLNLDAWNADKSMEVSLMGPLLLFGNGGKETTGTSTGRSFPTLKSYNIVMQG